VDLLLPLDQLEHGLEPHAHIERLDDLLLPLSRYGQVRGDQVRERAGFLNVVEHDAHLAWRRRQALEQAASQLT
jgi:hypothetical protein